MSSGPRCVALFDYEGEEDDELTFSQGDVIALQELVGQEWGRGQIHGRVGIFPLSFAQVVEPLPPSAPTTGEAVIGEPRESMRIASVAMVTKCCHGGDIETKLCLMQTNCRMLWVCLFFSEQHPRNQNHR